MPQASFFRDWSFGVDDAPEGRDLVERAAALMLLPGEFGGDAQKDAGGERTGEVGAMRGGEVVAHLRHGAGFTRGNGLHVGRDDGGRGDEHRFAFAVAGVRLSKRADLRLRRVRKLLGPRFGHGTRLNAGSDARR